MVRFLFLLALIPLLASCATPEKFSMYPKAVGPETSIDPDMAVILVGVTGAPVGYMQFIHTAIPVMNVSFTPIQDTVVAIPMPVGLKKVSVLCYTIVGVPAGYIGSVPFGYISADNTPVVDITEPGVYYLGTLHADTRTSTAEPSEAMLKIAREKYGAQIGDRRAVNFTWP